MVYLFSSVTEYAAETNIHGGADRGMSAGTAAGITFGAIVLTLLVGLVIAVVVMGWRCHKKSNKRSESEEHLSADRVQYGDVGNDGDSRV